MQIEFDHEKDRINRAKHGISLAAAAEMDFETARVIRDERYDYGEARFWAVGRIAGRLHILAFTMRSETLRAISLRRAN
ncbi:MAG: BrnT family toxin [Pseudomonadota bacterium]|nr:BrnT family toxin [Pseudomonadota bacterium]